MNRITFTAGLLTASAFLALGVSQAQAQETAAAEPEAVVSDAPAPDEATANNEFLQAQVESLQAQIDALKKQMTAAQPSWKGAPQWVDKDAGWSFKVRGRLQYDAAHVSNPIGNTGLGFSNEVRRARLGVEGEVPGPFAYKFELDFAEGNAELADAFFQWKGKNVAVSIGQHNNFQSLEELTSSRFTSFLERAAFTDAFAFERRAGVSVNFSHGDFKLDAGIFTDDVASLNQLNDSYSLDGRAVFAPKMGSAQLHLGGSIHHRELNDITGNIRYRQRPQVHTTDVRFVATPNLPTESETSYGAEAAAIFGPLHLAGEAHWLKQGLSTAGAEDPSFFGGYAEVGYFFTGETRGYKAGTFDRTKVNNPVDKGGWGALQAIARFDYLDLNDGNAGVIGGKQTAYQLGLTWIPTDYVRFLMNYSRIELEDAALATAAGDRDYGVDVFGMRAQIDF